MLGIYPQPFLRRIEPSVEALVKRYHQRADLGDSAQMELNAKYIRGEHE
jgi:hypothetical protein